MDISKNDAERDVNGEEDDDDEDDEDYVPEEDVDDKDDGKSPFGCIVIKS